MSNRFLAPAESSADSIVDRRLATWTLLAGLLLLIFLICSFLAGGSLAINDRAAPVHVFHAETAVGHDVVNWQPGARSGVYLTAEGQAGVYHPLWQFLHLMLPGRAALAWERLFAYPLMMLGAWLWLRRAIDSNAAATFGALLFTFSSFNLLHFSHPSAVAAVAHLPWLLWAIDIIMVDSRRLYVTLAQSALALLTGSQLLLGSPQFIWLSLLAELCYTAYLSYSRRYAPRRGCKFYATCDDCIGCTTRTWGRVVIGIEIGLLIGGVQLFPALGAWLRGSPDTAQAAYATWGALHPVNLIQLLAPYLFLGRSVGENPHEFCIYIGAVPLLLIALVAVHRHDLGSLSSLALGAFAFMILALLFAFGVYGGLQWILAFLPVLRNFVWPSRAIVLFQLGAAALAAIGFAMLFREYSRARRLRAKSPPYLMSIRWSLWRDFELLWCVVGLSIAIAVVGTVLYSQPQIAAIPAIIVGPLLFIAALTLVIAAARGHTAALIGLVLLTAVDLGWYGLSAPTYSKTNGFCCSFKTDPDATMLSETPFQAPASKQGSAAVLNARPGRCEVDLNGSTPQLVVLNEPYRIGWRAQVDGRPHDVYRVNGQGVGCTVAPGKHKVVLAYDPESLQRGLFASYLGLGLLSLCFLGCIIHPAPVPWQKDFQ